MKRSRINLFVLSISISLFQISYSYSQQSPYGGIAWEIPGQIEAEDFDNGGEGIAYHDATPGNS